MATLNDRKLVVGAALRLAELTPDELADVIFDERREVMLWGPAGEYIDELADCLAGDAIRAQALRDAADSLAADVERGAPIHPALVVEMLRSRADKIAKGEL